jgi:hypothetical protein
LHELYPSSWKPDRLNGIIANRGITNAILSGRSVSDIEALWKPDLDAFRLRRKKYLLYADAELQRP